MTTSQLGRLTVCESAVCN